MDQLAFSVVVVVVICLPLLWPVLSAIMSDMSATQVAGCRRCSRSWTSSLHQALSPACHPHTSNRLNVRTLHVSPSVVSPPHPVWPPANQPTPAIFGLTAALFSSPTPANTY